MVTTMMVLRRGTARTRSEEKHLGAVRSRLAPRLTQTNGTEPES
jgi:hypothetical protein